MACENLPKWECMWDDLIQEENRGGSLHETQQKVKYEEENFVLVGKNKGKSNKNPNGGATS